MSDSDKKRSDFDEIDTDSDGYITVDELKESHKHDPKISDDHIATIAAMADTDGDRKISYEEYEKFVR